MKGRVETTFYVSVSVGMALATSSFTMVGSLFAIATTPVILTAIALGGLLCAVIALSIGELASMYPSAPGVRTYFKIAFGDRPSLFLVYQYLMFVILIAGLESYVFSEVVHAVFPAAPPVAVAIVLIAAVSATNMAGLELPRGLQIVMTFVALALIALSGAIGFGHPRIGAATLMTTATRHDVLLLPALTGMCIFLYTGFEWVTPLGLRASAYERKVPASMPTAIGLLFVAYALFALGASMQLAPAAIGQSMMPQVPYFAAVFGATGPLLALLLSLSAVVSTFNAGILGGSQLIFLLSQERKLPAWCGAVWLRTGCPVGAILLLAALAIATSVTVLVFQAQIVAALVGASSMCVIYSAFLVAALRLRKEKPDARRPFASPVAAGVQWTLAAVLLVMAVQTLFSEPGLWVRSSMTALVSVAISFGLALRSSPDRRVKAPTATAVNV
jgi:ethanolamine permease